MIKYLGTVFRPRHLQNLIVLKRNLNWLYYSRVCTASGRLKQSKPLAGKISRRLLAH